MTKDQIKHMVDRFLAWSLPDNFAPDAGITYVRPNYPASWPGPSGTNLLDAGQATAMVTHMIEGLPDSTLVTERDMADAKAFAERAGIDTWDDYEEAIHDLAQAIANGRRAAVSPEE